MTFHDEPVPIGTCRRIVTIDLTPDDQEPPDPDPSVAHVSSVAQVSTGPDFGCTLWEAREP